MINQEGLICLLGCREDGMGQPWRMVCERQARHTGAPGASSLMSRTITAFDKKTTQGKNQALQGTAQGHLPQTVWL